MRRYVRLIVVMIVSLVLITGCGNRNIKKAVFTNLKPSITISANEYIITKNTVNKGELEKQIARVTAVNNIVSYTDENNPYKEIGKIYKIKNQNVEDKVAIELNEDIYVAEIGDKSKK